MNGFDYVVEMESRTSPVKTYWTGKAFSLNVKDAKTYGCWQNANKACQALNRSRIDQRFFYAQVQEINER